MLTSEERRAFDRDGLLRLPEAITDGAAARMCDRIWEFLGANRGVDRHDASTWAGVMPSGFNTVARAGAFDELWTPEVERIVDGLFVGAQQIRERGRVLMTFPRPDAPWTVPSSGWHFDFTPLRSSSGVRAVQVFALLSEVQPRGGGTIVLAGSHHLVSRYVAAAGSEPRPKRVRTG